MAEANVPRGGVSRRNFLKGAGALGAIGIAGMASTSDWLKPSQANASQEVHEYTACTYHQAHCGGMCPLKCTVRDGRVVLVQPNDACIDDRYKTICLKGISEVQHIYGDKRIQAPLKRVGERGQNEFMQISWDEALDEICDSINEIQSAYGKDSVMVMSGSESNSSFLASILGARSGGFTGIDVGIGNGLDPAIGYGGGYATSTADPRDWVDSKLVLTVGSNFCESTLPQVRMFFEAKEAGAKMITVDPHFSTTAGKSDEWVPIAPGTDAALFLGMISVILDEGLADEAFMANHTSLPFLVNTATGKLLRDHAENQETEQAETGEQNPFFVIDSGTGSVVRHTDAAAPALSGSVELNGVHATTAYDLMVKSQANYTAQWASDLTGIPTDKIKELARLYAKGPSSLALGWGGNDKMSNADVVGHAAALLVAITGNIAKPGAGVGVYVGGTWSGRTGSLGSWQLPDDLSEADADVAAYDLRRKPGNVRALLCAGDIIAQHFANMGVTEQWVRGLDLVVSMDAYFTEGAKWADYVLPLTTRFENDADFGNLKIGYNQIVAQQKIIDPLFEAKTDLWVEREIARRMGISDDALPVDGVELVRAVLETSEDPYINSISLEQLEQAGCVWPLENAEEVRREFTDYKFATVSGRMDVYYDSLSDYGQALPSWEACSEIAEDNPLREQFPLQLANVRTRFHIHNQYNDAEWIQQYFEPTIEINPADAQSRRLANGDIVEVFNNRGSFLIKTAINESIRPGSARLAEGATADYIERGNMQSVTNDSPNERGYELLQGPVIPFSDTLVEIHKA